MKINLSSGVFLNIIKIQWIPYVILWKEKAGIKVWNMRCESCFIKSADSAQPEGLELFFQSLEERNRQWED